MNRVVPAVLVFLAIASLLYVGYMRGANAVRAEWAAERRQLESQHEAEVARLEKVNRTVEVRYIDRVRTVQEKARTIVKEVPVYVTVEDDRRCDIPAGFVRLHDLAAAQGDVPDHPSAREPDGPASGIALSDVARTVAGNYGTCHENAERLIALQAWAREVAK